MNQGKPPLLLIIDDDPDQLALIRLAAIRTGSLRVITAESGTEALIQLQAREAMALAPPDLVVTDLKMPNMNGLELLHMLRERANLRDVPVIFLTTSAYHRDRLQAEAAGASGFFQKPMQFNELIELLRSVPSTIVNHEHEWIAPPWGS